MREAFRAQSFQARTNQLIDTLRPENIGQLSRAERAEQLDASRELVQLVTINSNNHQGTLLAINKAYDFIRHNQEDIGITILNGLDDYYDQMGISYKFLFPDEQTGVDIMRATVASYEQHLRRYPIRDILQRFTPENIANLASQIRSEFTLFHNNTSGQRSVFLEAPPILAYMSTPMQRGSLNAREQVLQEQQAIKDVYAGVYGVITTGRVFRLSDSQRVTVPEEAVREAERMYEIPSRIRKNADILGHVFDGVSWKQLIKQRNPERFSMQLIKYLSHLPLEDIFWRNIASSVFLPIGKADKQTQFTMPEFSKAICSFPWWITQKLFLPAIEDERTDPMFDKAFAMLLTSLDNQLVAKLVSLMYLSSVRSYLPEPMIDVRFSLHGQESFNPFFDLANRTPHSPLDNYHEAFPYVVDRFFIDNEELITDNLRKRFRSNQQVMDFVKDFFEAYHSRGNNLSAKQNYEELCAGKDYDPQAALQAMQHTLTFYRGQTLHETSIFDEYKDSEPQPGVFSIHLPYRLQDLAPEVERILIASNIQGTTSVLFIIHDGFGISGTIDRSGVVSLYYLADDTDPHKKILTTIATLAWEKYCEEGHDQPITQATPIPQNPSNIADQDGQRDDATSRNNKEESNIFSPVATETNQRLSPEEVAEMLKTLREILNQQ